MIITCEECATRFTLDDDLIPPQGAKVRCSMCKHVFTAYPELPEIPQTEPDIPEDIEFDDPEADDVPPPFSEAPEEDIDGIAFEEPPAPDTGDEEDAGIEPLSFDSDETQEEDFETAIPDLPEETDPVLSQDLEEEPDIDFEDTGEITFDPEDIRFETEDLDFEEDFDTGDELDVPTLEIQDMDPDDTEESPTLFDADDTDREAQISSQDDPADEPFPELEMEAPEDLEFETPDFPDLELEESEDDSIEIDEDTADIDITFDGPDGTTDNTEELSDISLEMDFQDPDDVDTGDIAVDPDDIEFDDTGLSLEDDAGPAVADTAPEEDNDGEEIPELELSFEEDPDADLVFEEDTDAPWHGELEPDSEPEPTPATDTEPDGEDLPDFSAPLPFPGPDEPESPFEDPSTLPEQTEADFEATFDSELAEDKFSEYDQVLDQDVEPEQIYPDNVPQADPEPRETYRKTPLETDPPDLSETAAPEPQADPLPAEEPPPREAALIEPLPGDIRKKRARKKKSAVGAPIIVLVLIFLLILAAYAAGLRFGYTIPFLSDLKIPYITEAFKPTQPPKPVSKPVPNEVSIKGRFVSNATAGELFIVTGRVDNPADTAYSYIRVKGTLITKDNPKAATQIIYCGNIISEEVLKSGNISDIHKQLTTREGVQNTNVNIMPGKDVPFMLVFSNLPAGLTNFTVEVMDFQPSAEKK
ncbi:MAG: DUF3426 domain-containing protein [Desulfobacter sp.]